MGHDTVDPQPITGSRLQASLPAVRASNQQLQGPHSLVQGSLLGEAELKLRLVVHHRAVGAVPLAAKAEEQR